jgi:hypothetical protein
VELCLKGNDPGLNRFALALYFELSLRGLSVDAPDGVVSASLDVPSAQSRNDVRSGVVPPLKESRRCRHRFVDHVKLTSSCKNYFVLIKNRVNFIQKRVKMTKDEINAQYSMNCTTIGDLSMKMEPHKKKIAEFQTSIDKLVIKNHNLSIDMDRLLKEAAKTPDAILPPEHSIVGTA